MRLKPWANFPVHCADKSFVSELSLFLILLNFVLIFSVIYGLQLDVFVQIASNIGLFARFQTVFAGALAKSGAFPLGSGRAATFLASLFLTTELLEDLLCVSFLFDGIFGRLDVWPFLNAMQLHKCIIFPDLISLHVCKIQLFEPVSDFHLFFVIVVLHFLFFCVEF